MGLCLSILSSVWSVILEHEIFSLTETTDTVVVRSVGFGRKEGELVLRTFSFKNRQLESTPTKLEDEIQVSRGTNVKAVNNKTKLEILVPEPYVLTSPKPLSELDAAATKLQKVYKSYRTRRNLADCAVVVEELWWKALDSAALERSSVSFFDESKHETAISRWARARTKAAKVGKGLSKDEHAQKLALQHWLEAIDPRHRYGHNLHFYYDVWSGSMSSQPFFYWLDVGDGKEVNVERCPRVVMQRQCIKYLGPNERESYQVIVKDGKLVYKQNDMLLNTSKGAKWIFVLSTSRALYIGQKKKGVFQHSSFMSGGAITAAGRLVARDGILEAIWPYSGHYLPTEDNFKEFIQFLEEYNLDLSNVKRYTVDDAKTSYGDIQEESNKEIVQESSVTDASANADASSSEVSQATMAETIEEPKFSLAKRLSCKWTSGVGPRIGCVRDYPMQLQSQALEKVNLSPRNTHARSTNGFPIPSLRPSPKVRMSPGLTYMGLPSPGVTA